jgi:hypothetical protein
MSFFLLVVPVGFTSIGARRWGEFVFEDDSQHVLRWLSIVDSITLRIGGAWCVAYEQGRSRIAAVSVFKILLSFLSRRSSVYMLRTKAESVMRKRVPRSGSRNLIL